MQAILFDKDGTLFDFDASWGVWAARQIARLAEGDAALEGRLAGAIGYDRAAARFLPHSPVIAGTLDEAVALLLPHLPGWRQDTLTRELDAAAQDLPLVAPVDLARCLGGLRGRGLRLGVATNDTEAAARAHLAAAGVSGMFEFVAGYDSGFGAKPGPGQLLGFAAHLGCAPAACAMVGDSLHDLRAARAAGMRAVAVLTGPARAADLAPWADAVLPDIGALAGWLDAGAGALFNPDPPR
ncbi:MAG: HAD-IA family hydrolase [Paracoccaceae bacterium]